MAIDLIIIARCRLLFYNNCQFSCADWFRVLVYESIDVISMV